KKIGHSWTACAYGTTDGLATLHIIIQRGTGFLARPDGLGSPSHNCCATRAEVVRPGTYPSILQPRPAPAAAWVALASHISGLTPCSISCPDYSILQGFRPAGNAARGPKNLVGCTLCPTLAFGRPMSPFPASWSTSSCAAKMCRFRNCSGCLAPSFLPAE